MFRPTYNILNLIIIVLFNFLTYPTLAQMPPASLTQEEEKIVEEFGNKYDKLDIDFTTKKGKKDWLILKGQDPEGAKLFCKAMRLSVNGFEKLMKIPEIESFDKKQKLLDSIYLENPDYHQLAKEYQNKPIALDSLLSLKIKSNSLPKFKNMEDFIVYYFDGDSSDLTLIDYYLESVNSSDKKILDMMHKEYGKMLENEEVGLPDIKRFVNSIASLDEEEEYESINHFEGSLILDDLIYSWVNRPNIEKRYSKYLALNVPDSIKAEKIYNLLNRNKGRLLDFKRRFFQFIQESQNEEWKALLNEWRNEYKKYNEFFFIHKNSVTMHAPLLEKQTEIVLELDEKIMGLVPFDEPEYYSWRDVQKKLEDKEAAIEIIRFNNYEESTSKVYYLFIIILPSDALKLVVLENGIDLEGKLYDDYNTLFYDDNYSNDSLMKTRKRVFDAFWGDVQKELEGIEKVYLSQDGIYHKLNINTLPIPNKKYLFDTIDIVFLNRTSTIVFNNTTKNSPDLSIDALLIGSPDYNFKITSNSNIDKSRFRYLKESKSEIDSIKKILDKNNISSRVLTDKNATESSLDDKNPTIVHFSTHAFFTEIPSELYRKASLNLENYSFKPQETIPISSSLGMDKTKLDPYLRSGIALTGANSINISSKNYADGILYSYEIENLDLRNTELVFLNACSTGKGDISNGQGVYGLQRAFFIAGADCVIMSLEKEWDSNSKFTSRFYHYYFQHNRNKNIAFKETIKEIRKKFKNDAPYTWGKYVMISM